MSKISSFAKQINGRFHDLRSLKPSCSFLENPFAINVVGDNCHVSSPITKDIAVKESELLELQDNEGLEGLKNNKRVC